MLCDCNSLFFFVGEMTTAAIRIWQIGLTALRERDGRVHRWSGMGRLTWSEGCRPLAVLYSSNEPVELSHRPRHDDSTINTVHGTVLHEVWVATQTRNLWKARALWKRRKIKTNSVTRRRRVEYWSVCIRPLSAVSSTCYSTMTLTFDLLTPKFNPFDSVPYCVVIV